MGFLLIFLCSGFIAQAQDPLFKERVPQKPLLFANLPTKLNCDRPELEKLLHTVISQNISLKLNDKLLLKGEVIEKNELSSGVQHMNIRLSNFGNALLNITITNQADNTNKIVGRIIHPKNGDALVIAEEN